MRFDTETSFTRLGINNVGPFDAQRRDLSRQKDCLSKDGKMGFEKSQKETQKTIKMEQSIISSRKCKIVGPKVNLHKFQLPPPSPVLGNPEKL